MIGMPLAINDEARWERAIAGSHSISTRVEVWSGDTRVVDDLPVTGGTVTLDIDARVTHSAKIEVADPSYLPTAQTDPLSPLGNHVKVYSGIRFPSGEAEMPQVFEGPIVSTPTWAGKADKFVVDCEGWSRYLSDDRFTEPYAPTGSTKAAITALINDALPWVTVNFVPALDDRTITEETVYEKDRAKAVEALADSIGGFIKDTADGSIYVVRGYQPNPGDLPVRKYLYGTSTGILDGTRPVLERDTRYNGVLAYNPDDPSIRHLATVSDPASPVRWGGPFGRKVYYFASPLLEAGTVQAAAETRLAALDGRMRTATASVAPDPSLVVGDHVTVEWPPAYGSRSGPMSEMMMIRKVTHPLGPGVTKLELQGMGGGQ